MANQCCNCGAPVENETKDTLCPACDNCRATWLGKEIARATALLTSHGYTVIAPKEAR
jgi:uncharacterized Zn finger protein (UPF0148 family)